MPEKHETVMLISNFEAFQTVPPNTREVTQHEYEFINYLNE